MTAHQFIDEGNPAKYFAAIPNIVFDLGLSPFELTLYGHIKRAAGASPQGKCTKSTTTLARETGMGSGTVSRAKVELEKKRSDLGNKPLIRIKEVPNSRGGKPFQEIAVTDIWKANMARYTTSTEEIGAANQVPVEVEPSSRATSPLEIKKNRKKKEEKKIGAVAQPKDEPLLGILLLRDVAQAYPPKESWSRYLEILGENPDETKLRKCRAEWVDRGYNKVSWKWFTEWYVSGVPERNRNGSSPKGARTYEWMGRMYALDEVISDDGQRYTVMGPDGTPTKRWHTLEAFAADKGITLEQAKHGMGAR